MALRPCIVDDCEDTAGKPGSARGMCFAHYNRWRRYGDPHTSMRRRNVCTISDCEGLVLGNGWCSHHYYREKRHGHPTARRPGDVVNGCRICAGCGFDKPLAEWGKGWCKVCVRDRTRRWRRDNPNYTPPPRNPEKSREWSRRWRRNNPDKVRSATATRRARRVAATVETFSVKEIFERDDWDCHICRQPIDRDLSYPDPGSASLDHVIPLSKGGPHSRHNCRAAHLTCNLRKQARLVGSSNG